MKNDRVSLSKIRVMTIMAFELFLQGYGNFHLLFRKSDLTEEMQVKEDFQKRMEVDDEDASRGRKRVFQDRDELSKASSTHNHNSNPSVFLTE
jgi:hypothetical protein